MKKVRFYNCDGGCLLIGNGSFRLNVPNGYGDGKHRVVVTDDEREVKQAEGQSWQKARWFGRIEGDAINVYDYDCYGANELFENVLFTVRGAFNIYSVHGTVFLVQTSTR